MFSPVDRWLSRDFWSKEGVWYLGMVGAVAVMMLASASIPRIARVVLEHRQHEMEESQSPPAHDGTLIPAQGL